MRKLQTRLFGCFLNTSYLMSSSKLPKSKMIILFYYLRFSIKSVFIDLKRISFFWYQLQGKNLLTLYGENFLRNEYRFFSKKYNPFIIDCGCNVWDSVTYFKYLYPNADIICFEPDPETYNMLCLNIKNNSFKDVQSYNLAVSDHDGTIDFFSNDSDNLTMSIYENRMPSSKKTTVKTISLEKYISDRHVDLLKIDVEWAEDIIIVDLHKKNLLKNIDNIILEYHHNFPGKENGLADLIKILENNDFHYQLTSLYFSLESKDKFQDVLIRAYRK